MIAKPKISIITVSYNSVKTIEQSILSVLNQTYSNIDYIIIDGGSTDGTIDIIKKYQNQISFWVSEPDKGIYDAMNKGVEIAKGDFVGILNSDDWYEKDTLNKVVNYINLHSEVDVFHGLLRIIKGNNDDPFLIRGHYSFHLNRGMIEHPTCFVKKKLFDKVGGFNLMYKSAADYDWMLKVKYNGASFLLITEILANFRTGGMSSTTTGALEEILIKKHYGIYSNSKYLYWRFIIFLKSLNTVQN